MSEEEVMTALRRLKVETGSLACLGCGYEHKCSTTGCAILRSAEAVITALQAEVRRQKQALEWSVKVDDLHQRTEADLRAEIDRLVIRFGMEGRV